MGGIQQISHGKRAVLNLRGDIGICQHHNRRRRSVKRIRIGAAQNLRIHAPQLIQCAFLLHHRIHQMLAVHACGSKLRRLQDLLQQRLLHLFGGILLYAAPFDHIFYCFVHTLSFFNNSFHSSNINVFYLKHIISFISFLIFLMKKS